MSRPVLTYAVGQDAVRQIFTYLTGTMDFGIMLGGKADGLIGYTNADFAGDFNDCKSTSRSIFFFVVGLSLGQARNSQSLACRLPKQSTSQQLSKQKPLYG